MRKLRLERRVARDHARCRPSSRWSLIAASSSLTDAASSETCGSSSSQIGRGAANRRESASFRFCPAESRPAGRSASGPSPKAASALGQTRIGPHRESRPRRRGSRATLRLVFTALGGRHSGRARGARHRRRRPSRLSLPAGKRQQPGDLPQQAGLAGAVRPGDAAAPRREQGAKLRSSNRSPAAALAADPMSGEADPFEAFAQDLRKLDGDEAGDGEISPRALISRHCLVAASAFI